MSFKNTEEQEYALEVMGHAQVTLAEAVAGAGKTKLGKLAANKYNNESWQFAVFNKRNAVEMQEDVEFPRNANSSTWHSLGKKFFNTRTEPNKMRNIITRVREYNFYEKKLEKPERLQRSDRYEAMKELVGLLKNSFLEPTIADAMGLIEHHGIISPDAPIEVAEAALNFVKISDNDQSQGDFDDMIRQPLLYGYIKPFFDRFVADEAQDNIPLRTLCLEEFKKQGVKLLVVGDRFQSINAWCGSDANSIDKIIELLNPEVVPLTVNFRCGRTIITEAQQIVPHIRAWDGAPEGEVKRATSKEFLEQFAPGDCAIARYNKIIIPMCFKLIRDGKAATIQGADFGKQIKNTLLAFKAKSIFELRKDIEEWYNRMVIKKKNEIQLEAIEDKYQLFKFLTEGSNTVEQVVNKVDIIFSDEKSEYKLSTIHKAKGGQWKNVFLLDNKNIRRNTADMKQWMHDQEKHLSYVARTRAEEAMTYVD